MCARGRFTRKTLQQWSICDCWCCRIPRLLAAHQAGQSRLSLRKRRGRGTMGILEGLVLGSNARRWSRPEHSEKGDHAIYCPNWDTFESEKQHYPVPLPQQVYTRLSQASRDVCSFWFLQPTWHRWYSLMRGTDKTISFWLLRAKERGVAMNWFLPIPDCSTLRSFLSVFVHSGCCCNRTPYTGDLYTPNWFLSFGGWEIQDQCAGRFNVCWGPTS